MKFKSQPPRILVVEDDADILNALNVVLASVGFDVDVLLNGKRILQNQFVLADLFVLDRSLPDADGLEICRYLKSKPHYCEVPVILISANPTMKKKAFEAGASSFIEKPFVIEKLVNAINDILQPKESLH